MPADEPTNAVPNTRIVTIGRQARAELSSLRFPFKRLVSVRGATRLGLAACYACAAMTSLVKIATQLECDARKPPAPFDASRDRFVDVAATWFGLNVAVALLLATTDAGCGVDTDKESEGRGGTGGRGGEVLGDDMICPSGDWGEGRAPSASLPGDRLRIEVAVPKGRVSASYAGCNECSSLEMRASIDERRVGAN